MGIPLNNFIKMFGLSLQLEKADKLAWTYVHSDKGWIAYWQETSDDSSPMQPGVTQVSSLLAPGTGPGPRELVTTRAITRLTLTQNGNIRKKVRHIVLLCPMSDLAETQRARQGVVSPCCCSRWTSSQRCCCCCCVFAPAAHSRSLTTENIK